MVERKTEDKIEKKICEKRWYTRPIYLSWRSLVGRGNIYISTGFHSALQKFLGFENSNEPFTEY